MKKLVSTSNISYEEWLRYRKFGIGGSDAGAICGLNPYRTAIQVYFDKTSDAVEDTDNEAMRQGRDLEDYVAQRFMEATGKKFGEQTLSSVMRNIRSCWPMWIGWYPVKMLGWNAKPPAPM